MLSTRCHTMSREILTSIEQLWQSEKTAFETLSDFQKCSKEHGLIERIIATGKEKISLLSRNKLCVRAHIFFLDCQGNS